MYHFSLTSTEKLEQCHDDIQKIFKEVINFYDCTIVEGARDEETQNEYYRTGKSKLQFPDSKHNVTELRPKSFAIDVVPCPIDWNDLDRFYFFAGIVKGVAEILYNRGEISHKIRCGCDWDNDNSFKDQNFNDMPHYELYVP